MSDNYPANDFVQQQNLWRLRNNVLRAALRVHLDYLDPDRPVATVSAYDQSFDDAVLELAKALQTQVPSLIVKVEGNVTEETVEKLREALKRAMRSYG